MFSIRISGAIGVIALTALGACMPMTQSSEPGSRQQQGLFTGAVLGGLLGAAIDEDDRGRGLIVGAAGGALTGTAIGAYLDRQAADLQAAISSDDVIITNNGQELRVVMPEGILFEIDSANVRADLQADLRALARNVLVYDQTTVDIVGHTDDTGSEAYNLDLSTRRASAVAGILLEEGVAPARVRSFGQGESAPIASNATADGRQQNRRVEIIIRPITG
ncbi:MAG: OmpA family protein [Pseudomonadota bacterium]